MPLPDTPNLDDRRFQQLVDEAKLLVRQKCPEWTDHNVSDPGVTLIEVFAWMTDQLIHRLNHVPDRAYVKFLDLLGVELEPPVAANVDITFWLSTAQPELVRVPAGARAATVRTPTDPAVSFTLVRDLEIVPTSLGHLLSTIDDIQYRSHTEAVQFGQGFLCFDQPPKLGDSLLIGLATPTPSCAVRLRFDCDIAEGHGVDPRNPPLAWDARGEDGWVRCVLERDETGGFNRPGDVVLHVPEQHSSTVLGDIAAGWIRCQVVEAVEGQPAYRSSPQIKTLTASTIGGTAPAVNAEVVVNEVLGVSTGLPGQRFALKHGPVVPGATPAVVESFRSVQGTEPGIDVFEEWSQVDDFVDSEPRDRHFRIDATAGEAVFGPAVRERDGKLTQYGAVPPPGARLRLRSYAAGGGRQGNVAAGSIKMLKSAIRYVARVENREPARGGVDAEDLESAKVRGPMLLRGTRAVAARDFEHQATRAAPNELARVLCLPAGGGADPGSVRVLLTPKATLDPLGRLRFDELTPLDEELVHRVARHLDRRRVAGVRVLVEPPLYMGLTVEARVQAGARSDPKRVEEEALRALYRYFNPVTGGPTGDGWPFGRPVHGGETFWVLQQVPGVLYVAEAKLYPSNPITGQRGEAVERLELEPNALVFSHQHSVEVVAEEPA
jgi:predicted phage baseplate assembly protein